MTTAEVAKILVDHCRKGEFEKAAEKTYSKDIVSVEPQEMPGMPREIRGMDAVAKKGKWWMENHTVHSCTVTGPYLSPEKFAVVFDLDATFKPKNKRSKMTEVAVYTVANGKIVHEEFLPMM